MLYRPNVCMIIRQHGRYLVVQRHDDPSHAWKFAQGGIEGNEPVQEAALREAREELGTDTFEIEHVSEHVNTYNWTEQGIDAHYRKTGKLFAGQQQRYVVLRFTGSEEDLTLSDEIDAYRWISEKEVLEHNENPNHDYFFNYNGCISKILEEAEER